MNRYLISVVCWVAAVVVSGCAFTTDRIELQYGQQQGAVSVPGASGVSVNVQVSDQRSDKSKVGSKKNGFGMETAPILAMEDVAVTVRRAMEQELRARGFQVGADAAVLRIAADLTRFYNDHKTGFFAGDAVADLNMSVVVKIKTGETLYSRQIVAQGLEPNIQLMTGDNARLALNRALENGMKQLFEDQAFIAALVSPSAAKAASN